MKKQKIISLIVVFAMLMSMFTFAFNVSAQTDSGTQNNESTQPEIDPYDFDVFDDYGVYIYAGNSETPDTASGMNILDYGDKKSYDNRIYHIEDDLETIKAFPANDNIHKAYNVATNGMFDDVKYITRSSDGAWGYRSIGGKDAFWSTRNIRYDSRYSFDEQEGTHSGAGNVDLPGSMYFNLNNDIIAENVPNVTFLIEYYDIAGNITFQYLNTNFVNNGYKGSSFTIKGTGTNTWKTARFQVTDAKMDKDWDKTGLANETGNIKVSGPKSDYYISKVLLIPTLTYTNIINPPQPDENLKNHNDGVEWWTLAQQKGVYISASNPAAGIGLSANLSNRLYDFSDSTDVEDFGTSLSNKKTIDQIKELGFNYATLGTSDGGVKISSATSGDGITKDTFFTTKNHRNSTSYNIGGNMYFAVTSDTITSEDDDVYVLIEYLDTDPNMGVSQQSNGTFMYKNQSSISTVFAVNHDDNTEKGDYYSYPSFYRHNTNVWRTVALPLYGSELTNTNTQTGLSDGKHDIKISANNVPMHVSRVGVVKMSDVEKAQHTYHAPETTGAAPTIWLAGDSIVETLDADAYPREGWGMELGNYFVKKAIVDASSYEYDENGYKVVNAVRDGVEVINRAKGGKSTRTFLNQVDPTAGPNATDTRWDDIKNGAKKGDYLFVSFFINDVSNRTTVQTNPFLTGDPGDRFSQRANIKEFKDECDKIGVNLVLVTPASNRIPGGHQNNHISSLKAQAKELGVPVIDVRTYHEALVKALSEGNDGYDGDKTKLIFNHILDKEINPEYSSSLGYADDTHINQTGAKEVCKIIVSEIQRKASSFESMKQLAKWIDTSKNLETMSVPDHQTEDFNYVSAQQSYIVNDEESDDWAEGEVQLKITVTNVLNTKNTANAYLALFAESGELKDIKKSEAAELEAGESATLVTNKMTVATKEGYMLRKFVWNSKMAPVQLSKGLVVIDGEGHNRRATLRWAVSKDLENATYEIYRDGLKIGTAEGCGYTDEDVQRGTHTYQVNAVDEAGDIIGQSAPEKVTVTGIYDVKQDKDVYFAKADINAMGNIANITHGINLISDGTLYTANEAKQALNLTDEQIQASVNNKGLVYNGAPYVCTDTGDAAHNTVRVLDKYGNERVAWLTSNAYRVSSKSEIQTYLYIVGKNTNNLTTSDKQLSVFIEYLGNKEAPDIHYYGFVTDDKGTEDTSDDTTEYKICDAKAKLTTGVTGDWRIARYDINNAYFTSDTPFSKDAPFRIASGNKAPSYISSVMVVKGDVQKANNVLASLNNMEFSNARVRNGNEKYPDGISIDFTSGEAVKCGMDVYIPENVSSDGHSEIAVADDGTGYFGTLATTQTSGEPKQAYLYFKADPEYIFGASDMYTVEVTYKADYDENLYLTTSFYDKNANKASLSNSSQNVAKLTKNETDNWQTVTFAVENPCAMYFDNGGAMLRLNIPMDPENDDKQLKVSKVVIKNASSVPVKFDSEGNANDDRVTLHIAADSIAAYYTPDRVAKNGITGWGMVIGDYLTDVVGINNQATPGASTVTFENMPQIMSSLKEGDYVLISFGHNDQMSNKWVSIDDYKANLTNWIKQIREKKAIPVLVTMIPQGQVSTKILRQSDSFDDRRTAVSQVAQSQNVMLVKLGEQMFADEAAGVLTGNYVTEMYCDEGADNRTHLVEKGARYVAEIIVNSMKQQSTSFAKYVK